MLVGGIVLRMRTVSSERVALATLGVVTAWCLFLRTEDDAVALATDAAVMFLTAWMETTALAVAEAVNCAVGRSLWMVGELAARVAPATMPTV